MTTTAHRRPYLSALARLVLSAVAGAVAGTVIGVVTDLNPWLYGWAVTAGLFVLWTWALLGPMDASATQAHATRDDPTQLVTLLMVVAAALGSLTAVGVVLFRSHGESFLLGTVLAVVLSWAAIHTVFAMHYARDYFTDPVGGIEFHQTDPPVYSDFAYVAFAVGMSFAISDTDLSSSRMRRAALPHALLSYLFGTVIVALVINVVAGLAH
ncbi:MAG: DUF1345 domain-containing protein [Gordonia sp. (in: high G+C Gram-positive bacteria)]|uniref:DUF1345 domain-containing protein n=1 Tax=Gordonia sp. (in: high G+C Gram-positive bacteria) TaxID=84139 RepID=UPI0039E24B4E